MVIGDNPIIRGLAFLDARLGKNRALAIKPKVYIRSAESCWGLDNLKNYKDLQNLRQCKIVFSFKVGGGVRDHLRHDVSTVKSIPEQFSFRIEWPAWRFHIKHILPVRAERTYPICAAGARKCPPEDRIPH